MKILRIGDPHIKPSNVDECERLMHFINDKILEIRPDRVEILGDLFHTHSIVRLEVLEFWDGWIDVLLAHGIDLYLLIGNHDIADTTKYPYSALHVFRHIKDRHLKIVGSPRVDGPFAYISYFHDPKEFVEIANNCADNHGAKVLICHQTFDGSQYENGFFAPDGIDAQLLHYDLIISGHIHTTQDIIKNGKRIIYPGTPKWDTTSDANLNKGIWLFEHEDTTGALIKMDLIGTSDVVTPILHLAWVEGQPVPQFPEKADVTIELIGTGDWIEKAKSELKGTVAIQTTRTDKVHKKERETGRNFPEFVVNKFDTKLDPIQLLKYMRSIKIV